MACASGEDSDQTGHPPCLIRVFAVRSISNWGHELSSCGQWRFSSDRLMPRLSHRWAHILLVLSCADPYNTLIELSLISCQCTVILCFSVWPVLWDILLCFRTLHDVITKTRLYNFEPLEPHFYIVKLGFTWGIHYFLISAQKHRLWALLRTASPRWF